MLAICPEGCVRKRGRDMVSILSLPLKLQAPFAPPGLGLTRFGTSQTGCHPVWASTRFGISNFF
jgi:hypothetical protein